MDTGREIARSIPLTYLGGLPGIRVRLTELARILTRRPFPQGQRLCARNRSNFPIVRPLLKPRQPKKRPAFGWAKGRGQFAFGLAETARVPLPTLRPLSPLNAKCRPGQ